MMTIPIERMPNPPRRGYGPEAVLVVVVLLCAAATLACLL